MPGGLDSITPWPLNNEEYFDADIYSLTDAQGYQFDFNVMSQDVVFRNETDCRILGDTDYAIIICVATSREDPNQINALIAHCPADISASSQCLQGRQWGNEGVWNTSLSTYMQRMTTNFARENASIIQVFQESESLPANINPQDLLSVYETSFNTTGSAAGTASGIRFIQYLSNLLFLSQANNVSYSVAYNYLQSFLILPLYYFHANNMAPNLTISPDGMAKDLPPELYTEASFATMSYRIKVGRTTVIIYIVGAGVLIFLCLAILVSGSLPVTAGKCPDTTAWPAFDLLANCEVRDTDQSLAQKVASLKATRKRDLGRQMEFSVFVGQDTEAPCQQSSRPSSVSHDPA